MYRNALTLILLTLTFCPASAAPQKPLNVVFILVDDYGWKDTRDLR